MAIDKIYGGNTPDEKIDIIREYLDEFENQYNFDITHISKTNLTAQGALEIALEMIKVIKKDRKAKMALKALIEELLPE